MASQRELIQAAVRMSVTHRNRYTEQLVSGLTDELAQTRDKVVTAITAYKTLGSLPDNKLAGLKGLEQLEAAIGGIMGELKRAHTVRFRAETKASFRMGVYAGLQEFVDAQLPEYATLTPSGLDKLGTKAFQIVDTQALDFLANYTTTLAGDVDTETTAGIMRVIRGAIASGGSVEDIVRDLGSVVTDPQAFRQAGGRVFRSAQQRLETIARTEVLRAHNMGKLKFHQAVGVTKLEWFALDDERMCPRCGPLNGKVFDIDKLPNQPLHPQCRCTHQPAWPLEVGDTGLLSPQAIEEAAARDQAVKSKLAGAWNSGDPAQLAQLTYGELQQLAKQRGVSIARSKADFLAVLDGLEPGVVHADLTGKALTAKLKQYSVGSLRSRDELLGYLESAQRAMVQAREAAARARSAAETGRGLAELSHDELRQLAKERGVSLTMSKADLIEWLDMVEPGVDHGQLSAAQLVTLAREKGLAAGMGRARTKTQLVRALEKDAGRRLAMSDQPA